jgi:hypothetical protein
MIRYSMVALASLKRLSRDSSPSMKAALEDIHLIGEFLLGGGLRGGEFLDLRQQELGIGIHGA